MAEYRKLDTYLVESLKKKREAKAFLDASIRDYEEDGDAAAFTQALRYIAEAQGGITALSERTQLNRQNLYKALTGKTTPKLDTTLSILNGLGYRFKVEECRFS